jgi:NADPH-dependent curcumin reductase CurA
MSSAINRQIVFTRLIEGEPQLSNFELVESPIPEPGEGELLLRNLYVSVDPGSRGRLSGRDSYVPAKPVGEVMDTQSVSEVLTSNHPDFQPGDIVAGFNGWQDYAVDNGKRLRKVEPDLKPLSAAIGIYGTPGLTAYVGVRKLLAVKPGEIVLISSAAGAVGSAAGQIAGIDGAHTVGIAGGKEKCDYARSHYGFDVMIDHKATPDITAAVAEACPDGIDAYFDNVGAEQLNAAVTSMKRGGRILICGQVAEYNLEPEQRTGLRDVSAFIGKRLSMSGFVVYDYPQYFQEARQTMSDWIKTGRLSFREHVVEGLENAPAAFCGLLRGENFGRGLVHVADPKQRDQSKSTPF